MHIWNSLCKDTRIFSIHEHNIKEIYFFKTKYAQNTFVVALNKLLAISVLNLSSKDCVPVYRDMLSILTPVNFGTPLTRQSALVLKVDVSFGWRSF